jgi:hypothetical protein
MNKSNNNFRFSFLGSLQTHGKFKTIMKAPKQQPQHQTFKKSKPKKIKKPKVESNVATE